VKRLSALALLAAAAVAAGTAAAANESNLVIRPGQAIGKFRLGMTEVALRRAVGRPRFVVHRAPTFGLRRVEYQYGLGAEYIATLVGRPGRLRVTRVSTIALRERTPRGIGPGSLERELRRAHPGVQCTPLRMKTWPNGLSFLERPNRTCTLIAPSGRRTIFETRIAKTPAGDWPKSNIPNFLRYARVTEVLVTAPAS
jgi:hypothetical protein